MNILHMKYAVEVARAGSINKAAETLIIAQPNLSRAIKELESDLGITIFDRSAKGMVTTPEGEQFLQYAENILKQINAVEKLYKDGTPVKQRFSISVPRASYISDAFARFSLSLSDEPAELFYKETNSLRAVNNILHSDYKLGIIRYAEGYDRYFKEMLEEKGLAYELITRFAYILAVGEKSPLASARDISHSELSKYIEIAHADPFVPSIPPAQLKKEELSGDIPRRIFVFERASQFELLSQNPETFMWVSPVPQPLLDKYGLVQLRNIRSEKIYKDVLIYRKDYRLSNLDKQFITELCVSKRRYLTDM